MPVVDSMAPWQLWVAACAPLAALTLDGVDGWVARRQQTQSDYGARYDMETDTFLMAVQALAVWQIGKVGAWVVAIGAIRYVFVMAGQFIPALHRPLPFSQRRRVICGLQSGVLLVCMLPVVPGGVAALAAGVTLSLLFWSFTIDIVWLMQSR